MEQMLKSSHHEEQFEKCADIFEMKLYGDEKMNGAMCSIHDIFEESGSKEHNCIGCNLDESTHQVYMFLSQKEGHGDIRLSLTAYFLFLYLVVERIETILEILNYPEQLRIKHFHTFQKVKKWANFIKHPKAYIFCHVPQWILESDPNTESARQLSKVVIDEKFIFKYFSGAKNNKELFKLLVNKDSVTVIFPDLINLTEQFTVALLYFVELLKSNQVYREILTDYSTIENFFTDEEE